MKVSLVIFIILFILLSKIALSASIIVNINQDIKGKIVHETQSISSNVVDFSSEFFNAGSVPYGARARIFVYKDGNLLFSGWSQSSNLMPGDRTHFDIFWYASNQGNYQSKLRVYFGNEMVESDLTNLTISNDSMPQDTFTIQNLRMYDNHVVFDLTSAVDASNVVLIPSNYMPGWMFEEKLVGNMSKGMKRTISLNYQPTIIMTSSLDLDAVSDGGKYYSEGKFTMQKGQGIIAMISGFLDNLRLAL